MRDFRLAFRQLIARPGFSLIAILSLAIGIGANSTMFSLTDALVLRPLPVEDHERLLRLYSLTPRQQDARISYLDYRDYAARATSFTGLAAGNYVPLGLSRGPEAPPVSKLGMAVSPNYFDVLGVRPALGRAFRPDEDREPVAVLSHALWQSHFQGDPGVVGRVVRISQLDFTIIGVAPESFTGMDRLIHEELYVTLGIRERLDPTAGRTPDSRDRRGLAVYGRLKPGVTTAQAQHELKSLAATLAAEHPKENAGWSATAVPCTQARMFEDSGMGVFAAMVMSVAGLVLLIACANVANLLLSRGRARAKEIAIRMSIGAGRVRLLRQLLTESLVLAVCGGAAGVALAAVGVRLLASIRFPTDYPIMVTASLDWRVLAFSLGVAMGAGLLFGLAPAWQTLQTDVLATLKSGEPAVARAGSRFHPRNVLVVGQIAVALLMMVMGGLLVRDFQKLRSFDPGFRTDGVLVASLDPSVGRLNEDDGRRFLERLAERTRELPGVAGTALAEHLPLGFTSTQTTFTVPGYQLPKDQGSLTVNENIVSPGFFALMHIPLVEGRDFAATDTKPAPRVVIVNQMMAETFWSGRSAIGQRIEIAGELWQVAGVAKTSRYRVIEETPARYLYFPMGQRYADRMTLLVDAPRDPGSLAAPVLALARSLAPGVPVSDVDTFRHFYDEGALLGNRLSARMVTTVGSLGLILAMVGLYGVIAYSVSRRTKEIGIRMAIGARPEDVRSLVLRQGAWLTAAGGALGLLLAAGGAQLLRGQLVGVSRFDPLVFAAAPVALAAVCLLACWIPARRAARIDPLVALRQD